MALCAAWFALINGESDSICTHGGLCPIEFLDSSIGCRLLALYQRGDERRVGKNNFGVSAIL